MDRAAILPTAMLLSLAATSAPAAELRVTFDAPPVVACREVTTSEFSEAHADEKLIEARIPISLLARGGTSDALITCFYRIESLERTMLVHDFEPRTTLATDVVGEVQIEQKEGKSKSLGLTLNGGWDHYVKGTANASRGSDKSESQRYQKAARLELLAASGTVSRGSGVYFKLQPSSQTTLEGAREFSVVFRVPQGWRGDYLRLTCEAASRERSNVLCGREELNLGLHMEGDIEAEKVAEKFATAALELRRESAQRQRDIRKRSLPTPLHQVAAAMSVVDPKIPHTWLRHAMLSPVNEPPGDYLRHLPTPVRDAVNSYREAQLQLHLLHGKEAWRVELLKPAVE